MADPIPTPPSSPAEPGVPGPAPAPEGTGKPASAAPGSIGAAPAPLLLFGKWDLSQVRISDPSLQRYLRLTPSAHSGGRRAFTGLEGVSAVERLANKLMRRKGSTGKKHATYRAVREAFERVHAQTRKNPAQVFVDAVANAAPREETVRLKYGGIAVPKAVDTSAQRRVSQALRVLAQGAQKAAFSSPRSLSECLAAELVSASKNDTKCFSISRREEKERMAKASR